MLFFALLLVISVTLSSSSSSCNYVGPASIDLIDSTFITYFAAPVDVCQPGDNNLINEGYSGKYICESGVPVFYIYNGETCSTTGTKYNVNVTNYKCDADTNCAYGIVTTKTTTNCSTFTATRISQVVTGICFFSNVKIYIFIY